MVRLRERDSERERENQERNRSVGQRWRMGLRERERDVLGEDGEWNGGRERERCLANMENGMVRERINLSREKQREVLGKSGELDGENCRETQELKRERAATLQITALQITKEHAYDYEPVTKGAPT